MMSFNSLCFSVANVPLHDIACFTLYGFEQPQLLGSLVNGNLYLKRTVSQNTNFDRLNSYRLIGITSCMILVPVLYCLI